MSNNLLSAVFQGFSLVTGQSRYKSRVSTCFVWNMSLLEWNLGANLIDRGTSSSTTKGTLDLFLVFVYGESIDG